MRCHAQKDRLLHRLVAASPFRFADRLRGRRRDLPSACVPQDEKRARIEGAPWMAHPRLRGDDEPREIPRGPASALSAVEARGAARRAAAVRGARVRGLARGGSTQARYASQVACLRRADCGSVPPRCAYDRRPLHGSRRAGEASRARCPCGDRTYEQVSLAPEERMAQPGETVAQRAQR